MSDFLQSLRNGQAEKPRTPKTRKNYDNSYHYTSGSRFHSYGGSGGGYPNTRNPQHMKRPLPQNIAPSGNQLPPEDPNITLLADVLDNLTTHVETLVKTQEYVVSIQERTAEMLERQVIAIEQLVSHLNLSPKADPVPPMEPAEEPEPTFENHYVTPPMQAAKKKQNKPATATSTVEPSAPKSHKPILRKRRRVVSGPQTTSQTPPASDGNTKLLPREAVMEIITTMREQGATFDQVAKHLIELGQPTFSGRGEWHAQTIHRLCNRK